MLVGMSASHLADVAQQAARNVANVEATGSIPVVRSISGVPVHKHRAGPVCMCAGAAAPACSESPGLRATRVRTQPRWKFHPLVAELVDAPGSEPGVERRVRSNRTEGTSFLGGWPSGPRHRS